MDIYKIGDKIESSEKKSDSSKLKITNLKQGVKNPDRVNVFLNGKYAFSLSVSQVVDFKIKVGEEISEEDLKKFQSASEFGKLYQRTLEWVLTRPRSEKETRDYLVKRFKSSSSGALRGASPSLTPSEESFEPFQNILDQLISKNYLNDLKFAEWYVQNRFTKKGISKRRLNMELRKKGIKSEIIEKVLDVRNDEEEIVKMIKKKRGKYTDEKLIMYLCRQGFPFEMAKDAVENYED